MNAQLAHLGAFLKERREKGGTKLQDVESATSIRLVFLEAIEEGDIESHIAPAYARGFIKQYANFLGIDGERLMREIARSDQARSDLEKPGHFHYGIGTMQRRREAQGTTRFSSRLIRGAFALLSGGILWQIFRHFVKI